MSKIDINEATNTLIENNILSQTSAGILSSQTRTIQTADISNIYDAPVFSCFLIDESGSMEPYKKEVIEAQSEIINTLRSSAKCRKNALYIVQYLFSDSVRALHSFTQLSSSNLDSVVLMNSGDYYNPNGKTALYKSLFYLLQDMSANIADALKKGIKSNFTIGVITDGEDNVGEIEPQQIQTVIRELIQNEYLLRSVIIGLTSHDFTDSMIQELKDRLGFQQAISLSKNDPKEIRRAFYLASPISLL